MLPPQPFGDKGQHQCIERYALGLAREASLAWMDFGTRATNLPEALGAVTSLVLNDGAGISRPMSCNADTAATKASRPFTALALVSPSDMQAGISGKVIRQPPPAGTLAAQTLPENANSQCSAKFHRQMFKCRLRRDGTTILDEFNQTVLGHSMQ